MNIFPYQFSFIHFLAKSSHKLLQSNQRMELGQICWKEKKGSKYELKVIELEVRNGWIIRSDDEPKVDNKAF